MSLDRLTLQKEVGTSPSPHRDWSPYSTQLSHNHPIEYLIKNSNTHVPCYFVGDRWGGKMTRDFQENKKMLRKEVKRLQKGTSGKEESVKAEDGTMLIEKEAVRKTWAECFEGLLNVEEDREPKTVAVGREQVNVLGELNEALIMREEVQESVWEMKAGKAAGLNGVAAECLKTVEQRLLSG